MPHHHDSPHPAFPQPTRAIHPASAVGALNRLAESFLPGRKADGDPVDLSGQHVAVNGHRVISVSTSVARELLGRPWVSVSQQAAALNTLLGWAKDMGGYYEVPIVRRRWSRPSTLSPVRVEQRYTRGGSEEWCVFWWHDS